MIGVFDSGLGGLTALKEILSERPSEDYIYFGDTGRVPYGTRSKETIIKYAVQDMNFLASHNVSAVLIACGTVSANAMNELKSRFDFPIIGVVESAAKAAAETTKNGIVGVLGTSAAIASGKYEAELTRLRPDIKTVAVSCPLFVPLVENGFTARGDEVTLMVCKRYLEKVKESGADTVILGCTHYPIIEHAISEVLPGVKLISAGAEAAKALAKTIPEKHGETGKVSYFVSDEPSGFINAASVFLNRELCGKVEKIDIEKY